MKHSLTLGESGKLLRKDDTLLVQNINGKKKVPITGISEIFAFGEIEVNSHALSLLKTMEITIHFFDHYHNYIGTFYPKEQYISGKLHIQQMKALEDGRGFQIAKNIVNGIGEAVQFTFREYEKNGKDLKEFHIGVKDAISKLDKVQDQKRLLQIEATIWQNFYGSLDSILDKEFVFEKRTKHPPENPTNALISFGKSLIYAQTISALYQTQLLQSVSYLHSPSERRFSLSLDLSEVFHILVVFRAIFRVVNLKKIDAKKHFRDDLNRVLLNDEGKHIFVHELETILDSTINHARLNRAVHFRELFRFEGLKLQKFLLGDEVEFKPFSMLEKR